MIKKDNHLRDCLNGQSDMAIFFFTMNSISIIYKDYFVTRLHVFNKITTALKLTSNTSI